jgi:hypothetical protein
LKGLVRKLSDPAPKAIRKRLRKLNPSEMLHRLNPSRLGIRAGIVRIRPTSLARPWVESMDATSVWGAPDDVHILHRFSRAGSWV